MKLAYPILTASFIYLLTQSLFASDNQPRLVPQPLNIRHYDDLETLLLSGQPLRALINYQFCEFDNAETSSNSTLYTQQYHDSHYRFITTIDWRTFYLMPPDHSDPATNCLVTFKHNLLNTADLTYLFDSDSSQRHTNHDHTWVKLTVNYAVCSDKPEQLNFHMSKRIIQSDSPYENGALYPSETCQSHCYGHCPLSAVRFYRY